MTLFGDAIDTFWNHGMAVSLLAKLPQFQEIPFVQEIPFGK
jgi:hypothetical protein